MGLVLYYSVAVGPNSSCQLSRPATTHPATTFCQNTPMCLCPVSAAVAVSLPLISSLNEGSRGQPAQRVTSVHHAGRSGRFLGLVSSNYGLLSSQQRVSSAFLKWSHLCCPLALGGARQAVQDASWLVPSPVEALKAVGVQMGSGDEARTR